MQAINNSRFTIALLIQLISVTRYPHGRPCRVELARRVGDGGYKRYRVYSLAVIAEAKEQCYGVSLWGAICRTFRALSYFIVCSDNDYQGTNKLSTSIFYCNYHFRVHHPSTPWPLPPPTPRHNFSVITQQKITGYRLRLKPCNYFEQSPNHIAVMTGRPALLHC